MLEGEKFNKSRIIDSLNKIKISYPHIASSSSPPKSVISSFHSLDLSVSSLGLISSETDAFAESPEIKQKEEELLHLSKKVEDLHNRLRISDKKHEDSLISLRSDKQVWSAARAQVFFKKVIAIC
jgi:hypothetical protein